MSRLDEIILGDELRKARESSLLTQEEVGERLGLGRDAILRIEKGTRKITADELYFFSKIYGLSMEELYTGEDREKRIAKFSRTFDQLSNKSQKDAFPIILLLINLPAMQTF